MAQSYRSDMQRTHNHSLPMAENFGAFLDFRHTTVRENLHVKCPPLLCLFNLRLLSKVKVVSFLLGLMMTFLILASYMLVSEWKVLLFSPSYYQIKSVVIESGNGTVRVLPGQGSLDMKGLVRLISSKLEFAPRKVPEEKDIMETDSHLFSVVPRHFLSTVKSPCWYEEFSPKRKPGPYSRNFYAVYSKGFKSLCERLTTNFQQSLLRRDGRQFRLRCLPYFYIIGQPKCGTTDLFHRLLQHPQVNFTNTIKEPHWWTRKRFGIIRFKDGSRRNFPLEDYLDLFDVTAQAIQKGISGNSSGDRRALHFITGDASASTMWDNHARSYLNRDKEETEEPPFLVQDFIHAVHPGAKILIILRDPAQRLYSDYLFFQTANKSAEAFHQKVVKSVRLFQSCLSGRSLRSCVYSTTLFNAMPVRLNLGLYIVFLLDWLTVFQREQVLVLQLEDYAANLAVTIKKVFDFLKVGPVSERDEASLAKQPRLNTRRDADRDLGPMLPATKDLLREFYQPFNQKLASVLDNEAFLWSET